MFSFWGASKPVPVIENNSTSEDDLFEKVTPPPEHPLFRVFLMGNANAGKTELASRYCSSAYEENRGHKPHTQTQKGNNYTMEISCYRGIEHEKPDAICILIDAQEENPISVVDFWYPIALNHDVPICFVITKSDSATPIQFESILKKLIPLVDYFRNCVSVNAVSAKYNEGVYDLFYTQLTQHLHNMHKYPLKEFIPGSQLAWLEKLENEWKKEKYATNLDRIKNVLALYKKTHYEGIKAIIKIIETSPGILTPEKVMKYIADIPQKNPEGTLAAFEAFLKYKLMPKSIPEMHSIRTLQKLTTKLENQPPPYRWF